MITNLAKFINGHHGFGKTDEWNLQQMKWMKYDQLYKYAIAKYTNKMIHSEDDSYFKDELLLNRKQREKERKRYGSVGRKNKNTNIGSYYIKKMSVLKRP